MTNWQTAAPASATSRGRARLHSMTGCGRPSKCRDRHGKPLPRADGRFRGVAVKAALPRRMSPSACTTRPSAARGAAPTRSLRPPSACADFSDLGDETFVQEFGVTLRPDAGLNWFAYGAMCPSRLGRVRSRPARGSPHGLLTYVDRAFEDDIPSEGLDGKVALIERGDITFEEKVKRVADAGAVGAIIFNNQEGLFFGRFANQPSIPAVAISQADGHELRDLVEQDDLGATVSVGDETSPSRNVIADMRTPRQRPVGQLSERTTHVPNTPGASDTGSVISTA